MNLVPLIVVLSLLLLPTWIMAIHILNLLITKGVKGIDSLWKPSPKLVSFNTKHRVLLISLYILLFQSSISWACYEYFNPYLELPLAVYILVPILILFIFALIYFFAARSRSRISEKIPPPEPGSPDNVVLEWQTRYLNATVDDLPKQFVPIFFIILGIHIAVAIGVVIGLIINNK